MTPLNIPRTNAKARQYAAQLLRQQRSGPLKARLEAREGWRRNQLLHKALRDSIRFYIHNLAEPQDPAEHIALLEYLQRKANTAIAVDFARRGQ